MKPKKNNSALWIGGGIALLTAAFFYFTTRNRKEARQLDELTDDLDDYETAQAVTLKNLMGVSKNFGVWTTNGEVVTYPSGANIKILNIMLAVVDWSQLQKKFRALCNGEFTLIDALNRALTDDDFARAISYAKAKKVVTDKPFTYAGKTYPEDTVLGAYTGMGTNLVGNSTYKTINEIRSNNYINTDYTEIIIDVPADMANLED